ncbi:MAG: hypothetical protein U1E31_01970 [Rickettsiales bacterium]
MKSNRYDHLYDEKIIQEKADQDLKPYLEEMNKEKGEVEKDFEEEKNKIEEIYKKEAAIPLNHLKEFFRFITDSPKDSFDPNKNREDRIFNARTIRDNKLVRIDEKYKPFIFPIYIDREVRIKNIRLEQQQKARELEKAKLEQEQKARELEKAKLEQEQKAREAAVRLKLEQEQKAREAEKARLKLEQEQKAREAAVRLKLEQQRAYEEKQKALEAQKAREKAESEAKAVRLKLEQEQKAREAAVRLKLEQEQKALEAQKAREKAESEAKAVRLKLEQEQKAREKAESEAKAVRLKLEQQKAYEEKQKAHEAEKARLKLEQEQKALEAVELQYKQNLFSKKIEPEISKSIETETLKLQHEELKQKIQKLQLEQEALQEKQLEQEASQKELEKKYRSKIEGMHNCFAEKKEVPALIEKQKENSSSKISSKISSSYISYQASQEEIKQYEKFIHSQEKFKKKATLEIEELKNKKIDLQKDISIEFDRSDYKLYCLNKKLISIKLSLNELKSNQSYDYSKKELEFIKELESCKKDIIKLIDEEIQDKTDCIKEIDDKIKEYQNNIDKKTIKSEKYLSRIEDLVEKSQISKEDSNKDSTTEDNLSFNSQVFSSQSIKSEHQLSPNHNQIFNVNKDHNQTFDACKPQDFLSNSQKLSKSHNKTFNNYKLIKSLKHNQTLDAGKDQGFLSNKNHNKTFNKEILINIKNQIDNFINCQTTKQDISQIPKHNYIDDSHDELESILKDLNDPKVDKESFHTTQKDLNDPKVDKESFHTKQKLSAISNELSNIINGAPNNTEEVLLRIHGQLHDIIDSSKNKESLYGDDKLEINSKEGYDKPKNYLEDRDSRLKSNSKEGYDKPKNCLEDRDSRLKSNSKEGYDKPKNCLENEYSSSQSKESSFYSIKSANMSNSKDANGKLKSQDSSFYSIKSANMSNSKDVNGKLKSQKSSSDYTNPYIYGTIVQDTINIPQEDSIEDAFGRINKLEDVFF